MNEIIGKDDWQAKQYFYLPIVLKIRHIPENMYWDGEFQIDENGIDALILEREERHD